MIEFRSPYLAIISLIAFIAWTVDYYNLLKSPQIFLPHSFFKKSNYGSGFFTGFKRHIIYLLGTISWVLLGIALAGPRIPLGFRDQKIKVNDLYFLVDVSRSMLAEDFKPNRIEVAKENILSFIKLRPVDRIGIIMFAREVFTLMPLTTDLTLIEDVINDINVGRLGSATNIGDAIGLAIARLMASEAESKVIILLTDGVSNAGNMEPREAARTALKENMRVYTIGVGSLVGAKLPIGGVGINKRYQNIPGGSIDLELLQDIAKITKAKSYLAQNEQALKEVMDEINSLEKTEIIVKGQTIYQEIYLGYLIAGVILLAMIEVSRRQFLREIA